MKKIDRLILNLSAADFINVTFTLFLFLLTLIYIPRVDHWASLIALNLLSVILIFTIAYFAANSKFNIWRHLHYWYLVPFIFITFKKLYFLVKPIRQVDFDYYLIQIDKAIFGVDPIRWLTNISHPVLTELLQISYATFFFLPIILVIDLLINDRVKAIHFATFTIVLGFLLSYIGYFLVPAIGPRFTLFNFATINQDLPGLYITNYLREIVNSGESIPQGTFNPLALVQRDVFPSGHTEITLLVMFLSFKLKTKSRYFFMVNGTLLVFSTMYLRYHYVIDVIGGLVFMIFTLLINKKLYNWWMDISGRERCDYNSC